MDGEPGENGNEAMENAKLSRPASAAVALISDHDAIRGPHRSAATARRHKSRLER